MDDHSLLFDSTLNWLIQDEDDDDDYNSMRNCWSKNENKIFEKALARYDETRADRWEKIAAMIPGKTVSDVLRQYSELEADVTNIEAGLVPIPGYYSSSSSSSSFTMAMEMEMVNTTRFDSFKKRSNSSTDQERKKGVPWTEEEHRRFLMGLQRYGKGDWRSISKNFVISKTPTQVASHAQKYYIRLNSGGGKDKRRPSIHDITTIHLTDSTPISDNNNNNNNQSIPQQQQQQKLPCSSKKPPQPQWFLPRTNNGMEMLFNSNWDHNNNNPFPCEMASYLRPHNNSMLQMQSKRYQVHG